MGPVPVALSYDAPGEVSTQKYAPITARASSWVNRPGLNTAQIVEGVETMQAIKHRYTSRRRSGEVSSVVKAE
jgi:hypothetical protein